MSPPPPSPASSSASLKGNILILEEEPGTRGLIARALTTAGATVTEAGTLEIAMGVLEKAPPDLLITALRISGSDGATLTRSLKGNARTKGLPILMLAPRSAPNDVMACLDAGADDIIAKPFFVPELVARVRAHLRSRRLYDALAREKRDLDTLLEIHKALAAGSSDPETVLETLVKIVARVLGVKRASIVLASRDPRFGYALASSDKPGLRNLEVDLRRYPEIERVMKTQRPLVVEDASASSLFAHLGTALQAAQVKSILAVPIVLDKEAVATLLLHTRDVRKRFSQREIRMCAIAAQTAGLALRDARLFSVTRGKPKTS